MTRKSRKRKAKRQLNRVKAIVRNCARREVVDLYLLHDFEIVNRSNHDMAEHNSYPHSFPIPRHKMLSPGVVRKAIKHIEEFRQSSYYNDG